MKSEAPTLKSINLHQQADTISDAWSPQVLSGLNNHEIKLAKFKDDFVWHKHNDIDEMFLVIEGSFEMLLEDQTIELQVGEMIVIPKGVMHCPRSKEGATVMLVEPVGTVKTGDPS